MKRGFIVSVAILTLLSILCACSNKKTITDKRCPALVDKADEYISYSDQEKTLAPVVSRALSGGQKILDYTVPDGELLNGPFYDSHHIYDRKFFYAYDAYYRREGHTQGEGPVSCHIFLLMNKTEAALMTVSFHDKDSVLFDNLFNVVKTFKWAKYNE